MKRTGETRRTWLALTKSSRRDSGISYSPATSSAYSFKRAFVGGDQSVRDSTRSLRPSTDVDGGKIKPWLPGVDGVPLKLGPGSCQLQSFTKKRNTPATWPQDNTPLVPPWRTSIVLALSWLRRYILVVIVISRARCKGEGESRLRGIKLVKQAHEIAEHRPKSLVERRGLRDFLSPLMSSDTTSKNGNTFTAMSDSSYNPSSPDYGPGQAISQQHYFDALERKRDDHRAAKRRRNGDSPSRSPSSVKQELSSPSVTPRATAIEANLRLEEYVNPFNVLSPSSRYSQKNSQAVCGCS
jgi:hypothetical protein